MAVVLGEDHVYELATPAYCEIFGRRNFVGSRAGVFFTPDTSQIFRSLDEVYQTGRTVMIKECALGKRYYNFTLQPYYGPLKGIVGVMIVANQVSEEVFSRKMLEENEKELLLNEERLILALKLSSQGLWDWDLATHGLVMDPQCESLLGFAPGSFGGTIESFLSALHPEDRTLIREAARKALAGRTSYHFKYRIILNDGSMRWIEAMGKGLYDESGKPYRMLGTVQDVTKRVGDQEKLEQAISSRDEFLSIASHELKTPLTSLRLQLELTQRAVIPGGDVAQSREKIVRILEMSSKQVDRLALLVNDLLDVSKIAAGKLSFNLEKIKLCDLVRDFVARFEEQLKSAKCELHLRVDERIEGTWDRARIEQVVVNLISNAIKYAPGAPVEVGARFADAQGRWVHFYVHDQGPGIAPETQARIFERFERADASRNIGGLGLGLYIVKQIVEAQGGLVSVESRPDQGARFTVKMPLDSTPFLEMNSSSLA